MVDPRHDRGRAAEAATARWLAGNGWRVLASRHRTPDGEIDLVATDPTGCLVAVEVRLRTRARTGGAAASVSHRHVGRVANALTRFAREQRVPHTGLRVDLVTVTPGSRPNSWQLKRYPDLSGW